MARQETSVNFLRESDRPDGLIGSTRIDDRNPTWQLFQVFQGRGYNLRFEPSWRFSGSDLPEESDIYCDDAMQAVDLGLRADIIKKLPDFRFIDFAYRANSGIDIPVVERVIQGNVMDRDVQDFIPNAQHITLSDEDKTHVLVGLLSYSEDRLVSLIDFVPVEHVDPATGLVTRPMDQAEYEELVKEFPEIVPSQSLEEELIEVRNKRQTLAAEPLSVERLKEIISSLADRVDNFLAPAPQENT